MKNKFGMGQSLVELLLVIGLLGLILPVLLYGLMVSMNGKAQQENRMQAITLMKEMEIAVKNIRDIDWLTLTSLPENTPYFPVISGNRWILQSGSSTDSTGLTKYLRVTNVYRTIDGSITSDDVGNILDPSTKKVELVVSWNTPIPSSSSETLLLTRTTNLSKMHEKLEDFTQGIITDTQLTSGVGDDGSIRLANNNRAKWCSPVFSSATIDLPDGPPVAVAATASTTSINNPNDVFVVTAPSSSSATKLVYANVSANVATPSAWIKGTFTLDPDKYSSGTYPTNLNGLSNTFKTNDVKYYRSSNGNLYALVATDDPMREVVVIKIKDSNGSVEAYQDSTNKIYKYWTFFNTRIHASTATNDYSPFGYGGVSVAVLENKGYVISSGYLYVFDLSNIDSATTTTSLPMLGCRIQLDGYDCKPNTGTDRKYSSGQTGGSWGDTTSPVHTDCSDGGNIELYANNDIAPVRVGSSTYVYVAVGAGTVPEFNIVNVTNIPSSSTSPSYSSNNCGRISGGASGWKRISTLDFNSASNTEEAANSVFAKSDGTRAYISSNGGIDGNNDGNPDSRQFYVINTSNPVSPRFLSTGSNSQATSGFYDGGAPASSANRELFPRRSLTVLNGDRAVLVGNDGFTNSNDAEEYQVLEMDNPSETTPRYCGGLNFDLGFNDLTSVSELDNDNYVYMVANTTANELKIIEGGPDNAIYVEKGTYVSPVFDTASIDLNTLTRAFNRFVSDIIKPVNTTIAFQTAVTQAVAGSCPTAESAYVFLGPNRTSAETDVFTTPTTGTTTLEGLIPLLVNGNYSNPGRCFRYKIYLSTLDQLYTPVINKVMWNYSL